MPFAPESKARRRKDNPSCLDASLAVRQLHCDSDAHNNKVYYMLQSQNGDILPDRARIRQQVPALEPAQLIKGRNLTKKTTYLCQQTYLKN